MTKLPNQFLTKWINFWVFVFCISVLAIDHHGGEAVIILLLTMAYIFITSLNGVFYINDDRLKYKLNGNEIIFITLVILFWLINLFNALVQPEGLEYENISLALRAMDNPMRWLLMLPIFFLFRRYIIDWRVISIGLSIGVFFTVSIAIYEVYFLGNYRASGGMNHVITFGELMVAVDLLLWVLMIHAWNNNNKSLATLLLVASLVAFYGSLLSVTRGAWLVYVFLIFSFIIYALKRSLFNKNYSFSMPILMRIFLVLVILVVESQTEQFKSIEGKINTIKEMSKGNYEHSGSRLEIFRTALEISRYFPYGVGTDNFRNGGKAVIIMDANNNINNKQYFLVKDNNNEILKKGDLKKIHIFDYRYLQSYNEDGSIKYTSRYRHAHNEWLNILAENGVAGIILLTLLFAFPLKIFWQNLNNENNLVGMYSYCGILLVVSFAIFGQTQSMFTSHAAVIFFIFFLFLFISQISRLSNIDDNHAIDS